MEDIQNDEQTKSIIEITEIHFHIEDEDIMTEITTRLITETQGVIIEEETEIMNPGVIPIGEMVVLEIRLH